MKIQHYTGMLLVLTVFLCGCAKQRPEYISRTDFQLNTVVNVALYDKQEDALLDGCLELCRQYERVFSRTLPDSELYQLNESKKMEVSDELLELIQLGIAYGKETDGRFDITIAPVSALWDFTGENPEVPAREALESALASVGYENIHIEGNLVTLENGASIDLGALAKGYIADRLKDYLLENGVQSAIINLGGNVLCIGSKPDGSPFEIGIQKPFADHTEAVDATFCTNQSVVTSGIYERGFEEDGIWYHHILDPDTGYPAGTGLVSATIQSDLSVDGDALSTICMELGPGQAEKFLSGHPNAKAWLITEDGDIIETGQQDR